MSSGVRKLPLGALSPDINNALVIGVIIAKQNLRIFTSRKDGEERGVWNFTLRDSPIDTINITFWGTAQEAKKAFEAFAIGDIVEVMNPRVLFKQPGEANAAFNPVVSSPFQLQLQANRSFLIHHEEDDSVTIKNLLSIPTKPPGDFLRLSDLFSYGQAMKGDFVNLLVAIRNVGDVRFVRTKKDSRDLMCRDVTVMDESHSEFQISLWSEDIVRRANDWRPGQTVLFFADVRLDWSDFKQSVTASVTSRTVITENPDTDEAHALQKYAEAIPTNPVAVLEHLTKSVRDPQAITSVMTTAQILRKAYSNNKLSDNKFTALIYATITCLDIDGTDVPVSYKCANCLQFLDETFRCFNAECLLISKNQHMKPVPVYNLKISLTDHRGTLLNCRLMTPAADDILHCPVQEYLGLMSSAKTQLKWKLLLSRCEVRLLVLSTSNERLHPMFSVLSCRVADPTDVSSKLPIY